MYFRIKKFRNQVGIKIKTHASLRNYCGYFPTLEGSNVGRNKRQQQHAGAVSKALYKFLLTFLKTTLNTIDFPSI